MHVYGSGTGSFPAPDAPPAHHVGHEVAAPEVELDTFLRLGAAAVVGENLSATNGPIRLSGGSFPLFCGRFGAEKAWNRPFFGWFNLSLL